MRLDEAKHILNENGFLLEKFDNDFFSKCFKAAKLNKLFSIERDMVFRLDGPSFMIVSNKNPGDKYLVRVGGKRLDQYINYKKVDEIEFGDEYDIILILKHKLETGKTVNFVNGEMIDYHMTEAKENNQTYHFNIEWNTGDMYWDNYPIYDEFEGTLDELNKYLNSKLHEEDVPANLTEDDLTKMLAGEEVYDETGEVFLVKI